MQSEFVTQPTQAVALHLDAAAVVQLALLRQPTQVLVATSHVAVMSVQAEELVAVHWTQVLVEVLQTGWPDTPLQSVLVLHCTQVLPPDPPVGQELLSL